MTRRACLPYWRENEDGSESFCELDVIVWPPERETYWQPGHPGYIEPDALRIDGDDVALRDYQALVDHIIETVDVPAPATLEDEYA